MGDKSCWHPKEYGAERSKKGRMRGKCTKGNFLAFGSYGLQATGAGWMSNHQIEAARIAITRHIKRGGKVWIRVFPDKPFTKKPAETRMGKGKGAPEGWVAVVRPGRDHLRSGRRRPGSGQGSPEKGRGKTALWHQAGGTHPLGFNATGL